MSGNTNTADLKKFSGAFAPHKVQNPLDATNPFTIPLAHPDEKLQVIGEPGSKLVYMPAQLRHYIPTLYKQVHLNTRALLSVNGYEIVMGQTVTDENLDKTTTANTVTSDIRNTLLRNNPDGTVLESATTVPLQPEESGMTKLVISESHPAPGKLRRLTCANNNTRFVVHDGDLYDTYYFTEKGDHIEYVQAMSEDGETVRYIVKTHGGYFANVAAGGVSETPDNAMLFVPGADENGNATGSIWDNQPNVIADSEETKPASA